jgi:hypothetical protein
MPNCHHNCSRQSSEIRQECACMLASWNRLASRASLDHPTSYIGINYRAYGTGPTAPQHTGSAAPGRRPVTQIFGGRCASCHPRSSARRAESRPLEMEGRSQRQISKPLLELPTTTTEEPAACMLCPEWAKGAFHSLRLRKWLAAWRYLDIGVPPKAVTSKNGSIFRSPGDCV